MNIVAERTQARLKVLGLSPRAASLRAGRQPYTVRDILSGKNANPKADLILDLAQALVCSTDYLLGLSADPGASPGAASRLDPRTIEVLQRIPADREEMVRSMLEGVANPRRGEGETKSPPKPRPAKSKAKR